MGEYVHVFTATQYSYAIHKGAVLHNIYFVRVFIGE